MINYRILKSQFLLGLILTILYHTGITNAQEDPCHPYIYTVLDDPRRDVNSVATPPQLCDSGLQSGWYRFLINGSSAVMPTTCVQPNLCGTQAPIWLDLTEGLPQVGEEVATRACSSWSAQNEDVNCCFYPYRATVRNCGEFLVYQLGSSLACNIAYCAEAALPLSKPTTTQVTTTTTPPTTSTTATTTSWPSTTTPYVTTTSGVLPTVCNEGQTVDVATGQCVDQSANLKEGKAKTEVFVNNDGTFISCSLNGDAFVGEAAATIVWFEDVNGDLQEIPVSAPVLEIGKDINIGQTIVCQLKISTNDRGPPSERFSEPLFLGIKLQEDGVTLSEDGVPSTLTFTSTVPIPCSSQYSLQECRVGINLLVFDTEGRYLPRLRFSSCYIELKASDCDGGLCAKIPVEAILFPDPQKSLNELRHEAVFIGGITYFGPGRWPQKVVESKLTLQDVEYGKCHVFTDPHVVTLDSKIFNLFTRGTFVLYQSSAFDFSVHIRVASCGNKNVDVGFCVCGVVIRDGGDVVSVDNCHRQQRKGKVEVTYPLGYVGDDVRVYEGTKKTMLTVVFATGRRLRIYVEKFGLSLSLFLPGLDRQKGQGLCGDFDNDQSNDFRKKDGKVVSGSNEILTTLQFVESWRLQPTQSLFENPGGSNPDNSTPFHIDKRCDCSPLSNGNVCPVTPIFDDVIPSVALSKDSTVSYFSKNIFPDRRKSPTFNIIPLRRKRQISYPLPETVRRSSLNFGKETRPEQIDEKLFNPSTPDVDFEKRRFVDPRRKQNENSLDDAPHLLENNYKPNTKTTGIPTPAGLAPAYRKAPELSDTVPESSRSRSYYFRPDHVISFQAFIPSWSKSAGVTEAQASDACAKVLFGAPVTLTCAEYNYVGPLVSTAFDLCKEDVQIKGDLKWANHSTRIIESACDFSMIENVSNFSSSAIASSTVNWPRHLRDAVSCPHGCGRGLCEEAGCLCDDGFEGEACELLRDQSDDKDDVSTETSAQEQESTSTLSASFPKTQEPSTTTTEAPTTSTTITTSTSPTTSTTQYTTTSTTPATTTTISTTTTPAPTTTIPTTKTTTMSSSTTTTTPFTTTTEPQTTEAPATTVPQVEHESTSTKIPPRKTRSTTSKYNSSPQTPKEFEATSRTPEILTQRATEVETSRAPRTTEETELVHRGLGPEYEACDIAEERCTLIAFGGTFRQTSLTCRVGSVEISSTTVRNLGNSVKMSGILSPDGQFLCVLPFYPYLKQIFPNVKEFHSLKLEAVDVENAVVGTKYLTIFDSACLICDHKGRYGCKVKPDYCYIQNECYALLSLKPFDTCLQCVPSLAQRQWSPRTDNEPPVLYAQSSVFVFNGQDARLTITASDPEGSRVILSVDRTDAFISQSGEFLWRAIGNDLGDSTKEEKFTITARDVCNATTALRLVIRSLPCDCFNGGSCLNPRFSSKSDFKISYECQCRNGYHGPKCEFENNECDPNPCERGTCVDLLNGFKCLCEYGFGGKRCDEIRDLCEDKPCFGNVSCSSTQGRVICGPCPDGYTGDGIHCVETSPCSRRPCFQGVACTNLRGTKQSFKCGPCPMYFSGDGQRCIRKSISACKDNVCSSVSTCTESKELPGYKCGPCPAGYTGNGKSCVAECNVNCPERHTCVSPNLCGCVKGYTGVSCDFPVCQPTCRNGGVCVKPNNCRCFSGYTGSYCQMTTCSKPCKNGGRCIGRNRCLCPYGYSGSQCQLLACRVACLNGGHCVGPNTCKCLKGYEGKHCETPTCNPPCLNDGTCLRPGRCHCKSGYEGPQCQQALCYPPCQHGGQCRRYRTCKCPDGYTGRRCQNPVCRPSCMNGGRCVGPDKCLCTSGWTGHRCDQPLCHFKCRNGGVCVSPDICACPRGYRGSDCGRRVGLNTRYKTRYWRRYYSYSF